MPWTDYTSVYYVFLFWLRCCLHKKQKNSKSPKVTVTTTDKSQKWAIFGDKCVDILHLQDHFGGLPIFFMQICNLKHLFEAVVSFRTFPMVFSHQVNEMVASQLVYYDPR
jgi:hypothetical protein